MCRGVLVEYFGMELLFVRVCRPLQKALQSDLVMLVMFGKEKVEK